MDCNCGRIPGYQIALLVHQELFAFLRQSGLMDTASPAAGIERNSALPILLVLILTMPS